MDGEDPPLPDGWTKHWSNTWKKHYWFDSKTGKQSWEAPTTGSAAPHHTPEVGAKRAAPDAVDDGRNKMARTEAEAPPPASKQQQPHPAASNAVSAPSPAAKKPVCSDAGAGGFTPAYWMRLLVVNLLLHPTPSTKAHTRLGHTVTAPSHSAHNSRRLLPRPPRSPAAVPAGC